MKLRQALKNQSINNKLYSSLNVDDNWMKDTLNYLVIKNLYMLYISLSYLQTTFWLLSKNDFLLNLKR